MRKFIFSSVFVCALAILASAQDRGLQIRAAQDLGPQVQIGKQWAVFIAIDRYREWTPLANPVKDAQEIRNILKEHYYIDEIRELYNTDATAANIRRLFADLRRDVQVNDSVFMFYAGHGHTDDLTKSGSWIPADGGRDDMAQANWLPNIQVRNMLSALAAKHVFLVADACFSGDILDMSRGAAPEINSEYYRRVYNRVSRQVMTSGASETVPDASEFAMRFKSSLLRAQNMYVDPEYIFTNVREVRTTQPLLGVIRGTEHQDGGSFLFFRRNAAPLAVNPAGPAAAPLPSPETGMANPFTPRISPGRPEFSLDGKKIKSLSAAPLANAATFSGKGGGVNVSFAFYEKYGNYGDFFLIPNSFYVSAELFKDQRTIEPSLSQNYGLGSGRQETGGVIGGVGAHWKIRLDGNQRFIVYFGPSLELFWSSAALYVEERGADKKVNTTGAGLNPGFGLSGGIGFRINKLISVDAGLFFKMGFMSNALEVSGYDSYGTPYTDDFARGVRPLTFGGRLGVTFWFANQEEK